jgi:hypothetical protein
MAAAAKRVGPAGVSTRLGRMLRTLWMTDYPRLASPYRDAISLFTKALDFLSADDRA